MSGQWGGRRKGAGRKAGGRTLVTVTLEPDLIRWLNSQDSDRSQRVRAIIRAAMAAESQAERAATQ